MPIGHVYSENDTGFRYLQTTDFINKSLKYSAMRFLFPLTFKFLKRYEIINGDIFISIAGVNLGIAGVFRSNITDRTILTENAAKIELTGNDFPEFVATQINGPIIQTQIEADKGVGAGVPKLALFRIQSLVFPWPTPGEQQKIFERIKAVESSYDQEKNNLYKLIKVKKGLMLDLLAGKTRVTDLQSTALTPESL